jgi:hypothetical protein
MLKRSSAWQLPQHWRAELELLARVPINIGLAALNVPSLFSERSVIGSVGSESVAWCPGKDGKHALEYGYVERGRTYRPIAPIRAPYQYKEISSACASQKNMLVASDNDAML